VLVKTFPEVKPRELPEHLEKPLMHGFVKTVQRPDFLDALRVQALAPGTIFKEISYGIPGGRQPPLATTIPVPQRWQIVAYVQSLGVSEP
jgi:hypothetical protein